MAKLDTVSPNSLKHSMISVLLTLLRRCADLFCTLFLLTWRWLTSSKWCHTQFITCSRAKNLKVVCCCCVDLDILMLLDLLTYIYHWKKEGHLDLVYWWMMIFVQQLLMWVLLLFYACCKAVGFLTKLLWIYADNPCTNQVSAMSCQPAVEPANCDILLQRAQPWDIWHMSYCMLDTNDVLPHAWVICTLKYLLMYDEPAGKVDVWPQLFSVPRSAISKLAAFYCSTWRFLWSMIGCLLQ